MRNGAESAAARPFSLAAYIILPIEGHTSFPLYVSIYNSPRNICSSRCLAIHGPQTPAHGERSRGQPRLARGIDVLRLKNNASYLDDGRALSRSEPTCPSRPFPLRLLARHRVLVCEAWNCYSFLPILLRVESDRDSIESWCDRLIYLIFIFLLCYIVYSIVHPIQFYIFLYFMFFYNEYIWKVFELETVAKTELFVN